MAHECPECYTRCHCGGDIDDLALPMKDGQYCRHCDHVYDEDDYEFDDEDLGDY